MDPCEQPADSVTAAIWEEAATLHLLQHGTHLPELAAADQKHATQHASRYQFQGQEFFSFIVDGRILSESPWNSISDDASSVAILCTFSPKLLLAFPVLWALCRAVHQHKIPSAHLHRHGQHASVGKQAFVSAISLGGT